MGLRPGPRVTPSPSHRLGCLRASSYRRSAWRHVTAPRLNSGPGGRRDRLGLRLGWTGVSLCVRPVTAKDSESDHRERRAALPLSDSESMIPTASSKLTPEECPRPGPQPGVPPRALAVCEDSNGGAPAAMAPRVHTQRDGIRCFQTLKLGPSVKVPTRRTLRVTVGARAASPRLGCWHASSVAVPQWRGRGGPGRRARRCQCDS
jgi:hypothetical protein